MTEIKRKRRDQIPNNDMNMTIKNTRKADLIADSILSLGIFTAFALDIIPSSFEFDIGSGPFSMKNSKCLTKINHFSKNFLLSMGRKLGLDNK